MGKIRVKTFGDEEAEQAAKQKKAQKKAEKKTIATAAPAVTDVVEKEAAVTPQEDTVAAEAKEPEKKATKKKSKYAEKKGLRKTGRSEKYKTALALIEKTKTYTLSDALTLLPKINTVKFDQTVELHINTIERGVTGSVTLPHGTGKQIRVAIADDAVIAAVEKGKIDFDVLLAAPHMMPKLAKVAKFLGPKGLMPNPKNGTITPNPVEAAKKYAGGHMQYKTEGKAPIIHLSVGKLSFGDKKLAENITTIVASMPLHKVKDATIKLTMSPGIKVDLSSAL